MIDYLIAALWGFAEASFFFFLPDIYLSRIAIISSSRAIKACFITAIAACLGGSLMYLWGYTDSATAYHFLTFIPAIYPKMITQAIQSLTPNPWNALLLAPFKGIPYKIYAVAFGASRINFLAFLIISFVARLLRFLLITLIAICLVALLKQHIKQKTLIYFHLFIWTIIYIGYFTLVSFNYS